LADHDDRIIIDSYSIDMEHEVINIEIFRDMEGFYHYDISIRNISKTTQLILKQIREEFISKINISEEDDNEQGEGDTIKEKFKEEILLLIKKYFPNADRKTSELLLSELIRQNIGLGDIEIMLKDSNLEEIVVNSSKDKIWVYHKKHGWLKTNIKILNEGKIRRYATMIG